MQHGLERGGSRSAWQPFNMLCMRRWVMWGMFATTVAIASATSLPVTWAQPPAVTTGVSADAQDATDDGQEAGDIPPAAE